MALLDSNAIFSSSVSLVKKMLRNRGSNKAHRNKTKGDTSIKYSTPDLDQKKGMLTEVPWPELSQYSEQLNEGDWEPRTKVWFGRRGPWWPTRAWRWIEEFVPALYRSMLPGSHWFYGFHDRIWFLICLVFVLWVTWMVMEGLLKMFRPVSAQSNCSVVYVTVTPGPILTVSLIEGPEPETSSNPNSITMPSISIPTSTTSNPDQGTYYYSVVNGTTEWAGGHAPPTTAMSLVTTTMFVTIQPSPVRPSSGTPLPGTSMVSGSTATATSTRGLSSRLSQLPSFSLNTSAMLSSGQSTASTVPGVLPPVSFSGTISSISSLSSGKLTISPGVSTLLSTIQLPLPTLTEPFTSSLGTSTLVSSGTLMTNSGVLSLSSSAQGTNPPGLTITTSSLQLTSSSPSALISSGQLTISGIPISLTSIHFPKSSGIMSSTSTIMLSLSSSSPGTQPTPSSLPLSSGLNSQITAPGLLSLSSFNTFNGTSTNQLTLTSMIASSTSSEQATLSTFSSSTSSNFAGPTSPTFSSILSSPSSLALSSGLLASQLTTFTISTLSSTASLSTVPNNISVPSTIITTSAVMLSTSASVTSLLVTPTSPSMTLTSDTTLPAPGTTGWNGTVPMANCTRGIDSSFGTGSCITMPTSSVKVKVISFEGQAYSFSFPSTTGGISVNVSYWTGIYPTATDTAESASTTTPVVSIGHITVLTTLRTVTSLPPFTLDSSAAATATNGPGGPRAAEASCGESGNFTITWDDTASVQPVNDRLSVALMTNPYHHLFSANGYAYVPPGMQPYGPVSAPNVAMFFPKPGPTWSDMPFAGSMLPGEIGAGARAAVDAYWFHAYSAWFGCNNPGPIDCIMRISGYQYDNSTSNEVLVAQQNATIPACTGFLDCHLTPVNFTEKFRALSGIQFEAFLDGIGPQIFMMDSLAMGWYNNSCSAGILRIGNRK